MRPETAIDHTKVKIQVFFCDTVNNDQVVLTNADVSYEWVTPGHDWSDTGTEVLDVAYFRRNAAILSPEALCRSTNGVPDSVRAQRAARKPQRGRRASSTSERAARIPWVRSSAFITRISCRPCEPSRPGCLIFSRRRLRSFAMMQ